MKKFFLISIISLFFSLESFSQKQKQTPYFLIQDNDTIGIVISIEQAQKIDNDLELVNLLKSKGIKCDSLLNTYISIVNEYDNQISILNLKNSSLENIKRGQDEIIKNLKLQIDNYKMDLYRAEQQIELSNKVISNNEKQIKNLKINNKLILGGGIIATIIGILSGIIISN